MYEMIQSLCNSLPTNMHVAPITLAGAAIAAFALLVYFITRTPEMLLVVLTAVAYAIVPVLPALT